MPTRPDCIILAAGRSRRFGTPKLLHPLGDGRALILHTLQPYLATFERPKVVINPRDDALAELLASQALEVVEAPDSDAGMSRSLIAGLAGSGSKSGWLIALADMPNVKSATLRALVEARCGDDIVVPTYRGQRGNPVLFDACFGAELAKLKGDIGGKPVLTANPSAVRELAVDDPGVLFDIDQPKDISAL